MLRIFKNTYCWKEELLIRWEGQVRPFAVRYESTSRWDVHLHQMTLCASFFAAGRPKPCTLWQTLQSQTPGRQQELRQGW